MHYEIHNGDCLEVMRAMGESSVDAIVTDPPYGLSFMGKGWDHAVPGVEFWAEALRVAKPGAHLLAFGGTRLYHRLTCAIEDAGWEVRDCLMWLYGSGFPKSHDVSKAIDRAAGAEREVTAKIGKCGMATAAENYEGNEKWSGLRRDTPATDAAKRWQGWGTALKPAYEPIIFARKPLAGTVASNVLEHGTGAINVDGCRVGDDGGTRRDGKADKPNDSGWENMRGHGVAELNAGRWPANLLLEDGTIDAEWTRYFYQPKASKADRDEGLPDGTRSTHPTVKPTDLMRYLCRLVTPPGAKILDPFMGSGSTGKAAALEGFQFIGIDLDPNYCDIARRRIEHASAEAGLYTATA